MRAMVSALNAGASFNDSFSLSLGTIGDFYLFAVADYDNVVIHELAEGNNSSDGAPISVIGPLCLVAIVVPHLRLRGGPAAILAAVGTTLLGSVMPLPAGTVPLLAMAAAAAAGLGAARLGRARIGALR